MKKTVFFLSIVFSLLFIIFSASAEDSSPVYPDALNDGTYKIEVDSSSSMFRIIDCELVVADGQMTARMTLSGTGYEKLFMGKGDDALDADESEFIYFEEDADGKYTYTVPIEALDKETECAAWSIRKETWYDRTLVFKSELLPEDAFKRDTFPAAPLISVSTAILCAAAAIIYSLNKKRK